MKIEIPIGGIISWAKSLGNVPQTLPYGWAICDGSLVSDAQSIFDGLVLPNLTNKFLRGSGSSGLTGGADDHAHYASTAVSVAAGSDYTVFEDNNGINSTGGAFPTGLPSYYEVVFIIRIK
jgi:hypothetical protein